MVEKFEGAFGKGTLDLLPERPRFVFCGTDMAFGANFVFERERVGSHLAGYADPQGFTLGQAVAASACFPPLFGPMRIERAAERFKGGRANGTGADERRRVLGDLRVTDGGVYDNLGLEPVWKSHRVVLVSDAGGLMDAEDDRSFFWRIKRYQEIQERQARGAGRFVGLMSGSRVRLRGMRGFGKAGTRSALLFYARAACVGALLDKPASRPRLPQRSFGPFVIDAAVRTHVPELMGVEGVPFAWPAPEFAPPAMVEEELRRRLAGSSRRKLTGRG